MNDRPHERHRSTRPPPGRDPASGRRWETWDDARGDGGDDESWSPARPSRPNGRNPSRPGDRADRGADRGTATYNRRSRPSRLDAEDEWRRDDVDAWAPARDRANPSARGGARQTTRRSGDARGDVRGTARTQRGGARRLADTVERWGETSVQWAVSAARRVFSTKQPALGRRTNGAGAAKDGPGGSVKRSPRITTLVVILLLAILPVLGAIQLGVVYLQVRDGLAHLKNAQTDLGTLASHPFDPNSLAQIRAEFVAANGDFSAASGGLDRVGVLGIVPIAGPKLSGAQRLMPIAAEATQAGIIGIDALSILAPKMKNPFDATGAVITAADLTAFSQRMEQVVPMVNQIITQVQQLQPSDLTLDPRIGPLVTTLDEKLPQIKQLLTDLPGMLAATASLLGVGTPSQYLLEVQDSTELRPGGGFIGNYGFVTLSGGHMSDIKMQDVDLLDASVKYGNQVIPLPKGYDWFAGVFKGGRWGFRDSNLDGDFPTSAKYGEHLYQLEDGSVSPVGVIAITPWLIKSALSITGPITMPQYNNLKITPDNLVDEIHYYQLTNGVPGGPDSVYDPTCGSSERKCFTGYLFKNFMAQVKSQSSQDMGPLLKVILDGLHSKDIQIYLNSAPAEDLLNQLHLANTIQAPATGDSYFDVDANIIANKSNYVVTDTLTDQVTIDAKGNTTHHSVMTYTWPKDPKTLQETYPADPGNAGQLVQYQRVYLPTTAQIGKQALSGWYITSTSTAFNRQVYGGRMHVTYGTTTDLGLDWSNPGAVVHDASGWHYTYLIQKQGGITYALSAKIALPTCAQLTTPVPSGFTQTDPHTLTLVPEPFTQDTTISFSYTGC